MVYECSLRSLSSKYNFLYFLETSTYELEISADKTVKPIIRKSQIIAHGNDVNAKNPIVSPMSEYNCDAIKFVLSKGQYFFASMPQIL
jgi:hypothetical protein